MGKLLILFILTSFLAGCSSNKSNDFISLKQKALEIPPDFELTPPGEGEDANKDASESSLNETSDLESLIMDNKDIAETDSTNEVNIDSESLEELIESQF